MRFSLCICFICVALCAQSSGFRDDITLFVKHEFGINITPATKIIYHTKKDVEAEFGRKPISKAKLEKVVKLQWSTEANSFIDSLYTTDDNGRLNGDFLDFKGDSKGGYTKGYFLHGEKDSVWTIKISSDYREIERYTNGKENGIWESVYTDGRKGYLKKYSNGIQVDTALHWWPNGNLMDAEIYDKGNMIKKKCYAEDGKEMKCIE